MAKNILLPALIFVKYEMALALPKKCTENSV
jgi:hypothetical protein